MKRIKGIDVSKYQTEIDWDRVHAEGVEFAFARTGDGLNERTHGEPDHTFKTNWVRMKEAGIVCGAYHFFRAKLDPAKQARLFLDTVADAGGFERDDLPPVVDVEEIGCRGVSPVEVVAKLRIFLSIVERETGKLPMIYTTPNQWGLLRKGGSDSLTFSGHPLWISHYQTTEPLVPKPWARWCFWQYTGTGGIRGVPGAVCEDLFDGSFEELLVFAEEMNLNPPEEPEPEDYERPTEPPEERRELETVPDVPPSPAQARHGAFLWLLAVLAWLVRLFKGGKGEG